MKKELDKVFLADEILIEQYREGNNQALVDLIARYIGIVDKKLMTYRQLQADCDDAKQEVLISFLNAVTTYDAEKQVTFATYASRCMDNAIKNFLNKLNTKKTQLLKQAISIDQFDEIHHHNAHNDNPETILIDRERYQTLLQTINIDLSEFEKNVLFCYLDGKSYNEISSLYQSSPKAVDNAMQRVRRKLKTVSEYEK